MATIVRKETRKRGFFGWIFLLLFVLFNVVMGVWLFSYWTVLSQSTAGEDAEAVGRAIGGTIGSGVLLFFWAAGDIVLGLFVLLTRGRKTIVEETVAL